VAISPCTDLARLETDEPALTLYGNDPGQIKGQSSAMQRGRDAAAHYLSRGDSRDRGNSFIWGAAGRAFPLCLSAGGNIPLSWRYRAVAERRVAGAI
jgi:hypothetical protein